MSTVVHPFHFYVIRAFAICAYYGSNWPVSDEPGASLIHKEVLALKDKFVNPEKIDSIFAEYILHLDRASIGANPQNRFEMLLGKGKKRANIGTDVRNDLVKCVNAILCLQKITPTVRGEKFPLFNDLWENFENEWPVPEEYDRMTESEKEKKINEDVKKFFTRLSAPDEMGKNNETAQEAEQEPGVERFICFRSSSNGRFIHVYEVKIKNREDVEILKLHSISDKEDAYEKSKAIRETGSCTPLADDRWLIQIYKEEKNKDGTKSKEVHSLSIFEVDEKKDESRGFRLGYNWKKPEQLSATRFYLIPVEKLAERIQKVKSTSPSSNYNINDFLKRIPFDIKVSNRAFNIIPFLPKRRFLPMRLGGVIDNAMTFYDGGNNDNRVLPNLAMLKVFFYSAKGVLAAKSAEHLTLEDYKRAAEYLTKSIEHGLLGYINEIQEKNSSRRHAFDKEQEIFNRDCFRGMFHQIVNGADNADLLNDISWRTDDVIFELRQRYDITADYSESQNSPELHKDPVTGNDISEKNWIYRFEGLGGCEDDELSEYLKIFFGQ